MAGVTRNCSPAVMISRRLAGSNSFLASTASASICKNTKGTNILSTDSLFMTCKRAAGSSRSSSLISSSVPPEHSVANIS